MEQIEVTARFDRDGNITPLNLTWNESEYPVVSTGRQWNDSDGQHVLIMLPGERVYELLFKPDERFWYIKRIGIDRMTA